MNLNSYQLWPSSEGPLTVDFCRTGTKHATAERDTKVRHTGETYRYYAVNILNRTDSFVARINYTFQSICIIILIYRKHIFDCENTLSAGHIQVFTARHFLKVSMLACAPHRYANSYKR